jgi:hypothetical protein
VSSTKSNQVVVVNMPISSLSSEPTAETEDAKLGLTFINDIFGDLIRVKFIPAVERASKKQWKTGVLAGYESMH